MTESAHRASIDQAGSPSIQIRGSASGFGIPGFVIFIAAIMALNGIGIDIMLPPLPAIGSSLGLSHENERQWVIGIFIIGFGSAQILWGPFSDRYGRKPVLMIGLTGYACTSLVAGFAANFTVLLAARLLQGVSASAARIVLVAIIRDCYAGRHMARVMSLAFTVFMLVPILAPSLGQAIELWSGSWRAIFIVLAIYAGIVGIIGFARLKETLNPLHRQPLSLAGASSAALRVARNRTAAGYTLASAFALGCTSSLVMSVEQIFSDVFAQKALFPILFACIAGTMIFAALLNAYCVDRFGTRRLSHGSLLWFIALSAIHLGWACAGLETVWSFVFLQAAQMFFYGVLNANFNAMAMEPVGDIAGSASSVQGFVSTCTGAMIGAIVGQSYDGTTSPLHIAFLACGVLALIAILYAERGHLLRPRCS